MIDDYFLLELQRMNSSKYTS